ncbi:hypothetical protein ACVWZ6_001094 [Bradyrhizobium sp. GM6.1]
MGRVCPAGRRARRRLCRARPRTRRADRHLVAEPAGMDTDPVCRRQGRPHPGDDQSGLPAERAGIRASQGRMQRHRHRDGIQDQQLHGHAQHAVAGARERQARAIARGAAAGLAHRDPDRRPRLPGHGPVRRGRRHGRYPASRTARRAQCLAAIRRCRQHPVHQRNDGIAQGRDADPSQHSQQRLFRRPRHAPDRTGPHLHSGAALSLLRHGDGQPRLRHARRNDGLSRRGV